jgi:hypothetical protein
MHDGGAVLSRAPLLSSEANTSGMMVMVKPGKWSDLCARRRRNVRVPGWTSIRAQPRICLCAVDGPPSIGFGACHRMGGSTLFFADKTALRYICISAKNCR